MDYVNPDGQRKRPKEYFPTQRDLGVAIDEINRSILTGKGFAPSQPERVTILDAMQARVDHAHVQHRSRISMASAMRRFMEWLDTLQPMPKYWDELRSIHISDWLAHCQYDLGLTDATVKTYRGLVGSVSIRMSQQHDGIRDIAREVRLKPHDNPNVERAKRAAKILPKETLLAFLDFLRSERLDLYAMVSLQALCGLRVLEATHLRYADVDLVNGTITVDETPNHTPKTRSSYRTIPVPRRVLDVLKLAVVDFSKKVLDMDGHLWLTSHSTTWNSESYRRALQGMFNKFWKRNGLDIRHYHPRDLRSNFTTIVRREGADPRVVQAYLGHVPEDTMGLHYEQIDIEQMRREVVARLETALCHDEDVAMSECHVSQAFAMQQ